MAQKKDITERERMIDLLNYCGNHDEFRTNEQLVDKFLGELEKVEINLFTSKGIDEQILDYLSEKKQSKISFKPTTSNLSEIRTRLKEKYSIDDCKRVIDYLVGEWKSDKMRKYIRPRTIFGNKFNGYLIASKEVSEKSIGSDNFINKETTKSDLI